jgi:aspartyl-tRNA(Asn)/glutamyl-tRNA(Gln) amidotransferase subunit B
MPRLNREALRLAVRAARALGCKVNPESWFARKHYFYPDLPKGYQISQSDRPLAGAGTIVVHREAGQRQPEVRIARLHMEEDAGKSTHHSDGSRVDLNRAGVPLVEIVSEPDLRSASEAAAYLRAVHQALVFAEITDGDMERGNFRCDANVSLRPVGQEALGARVELKNINSFRFVEKALEYEIARQTAALASGQAIARETRGFDDTSGKTYSMRSKEEAQDYRYLDEPDLAPVRVEAQWLVEPMPEAAPDKRLRYRAYGLSATVVDALLVSARVSRYFDEVAQGCGDAVRAGNFIATEVLARANEGTFAVPASTLVELISAMSGTPSQLSGKQGKELYAALADSGGRARLEDLIQERAWGSAVDETQLQEHVRAVVREFPSQVASFRSGKQALFGFLMGQLMKRTQRIGDPKVLGAWLRQELETQ